MPQLVVLLFLGGAAAVVCGLVAAAVWDETTRCRMQIQCAALRSLGHLGDVASVEAMARACRDHRPEKQRAGEVALLTLLPHLPSEQAAGLGGGAIAELCTTLRLYAGVLDSAGMGCPPAPGVPRLILDTLERAAGGEAVAPVRQIARWSFNLPLRRQACEVLPVLEARQGKHEDDARLLRPAEAPEGATLLRPAQAGQETPEEELLRPADSPKDEG